MNACIAPRSLRALALHDAVVVRINGDHQEIAVCVADGERVRSCDLDIHTGMEIVECCMRGKVLLIEYRDEVFMFFHVLAPFLCREKVLY